MTTYPRHELHDLFLRHSLVVDRTEDGIRAHCLSDRTLLGGRRGCDWSWTGPSWDGMNEFMGRSMWAEHLTEVADTEFVCEVVEADEVVTP